jgi:hypothetical protein
MCVLHVSYEVSWLAPTEVKNMFKLNLENAVSEFSLVILGFLF